MSTNSKTTSISKKAFKPRDSSFFSSLSININIGVRCSIVIPATPQEACKHKIVYRLFSCSYTALRVILLKNSRIPLTLRIFC